MMKDHRIYPRNQSPWEPHRVSNGTAAARTYEDLRAGKSRWMECWWMKSGRVLQHSIVLNILLSDYSFNPWLYKTLRRRLHLKDAVFDRSTSNHLKRSAIIS